MALLFKLIRETSVVPAAFTVFRAVTSAGRSYSIWPTPHGSGHAYEAGQRFNHRLLKYRGVVLFPWRVKVDSLDDRMMAMTQTAKESQSLEWHMDAKGQLAIHKYQLYCPVLVDPYTAPLSMRRHNYARRRMFDRDDVDSFRTVFGFEYVDIVAHEDIIPCKAITAIPFDHWLFGECFDVDPSPGELTIPYIPTKDLKKITEVGLGWLRVHSALHCRSTDCAILSVLPVYLGVLKKNGTLIRMWQFTIRVESKGYFRLTAEFMRWSVGSNVVEKEPKTRIAPFPPKADDDDSPAQLAVHVVVPFTIVDFRGTCKLRLSDEAEMKYEVEYELPRVITYARDEGVV